MTNVMILVESGKDIGLVAAELISKGLVLTDVQKEIGTITGSVPDDGFGDFCLFAEAAGASAVEVQRENTAFVGDDDHAKA